MTAPPAAPVADRHGGGPRARWIRFAGLVLLACYVVLLAEAYRLGLWFVDAQGRPTATDFLNVWAAGSMAAAGDAASAYDWALHKQAEERAVGRPLDGYFGWHYPPTFFLVAAPLAGLGYLQAWFAWVAVSAGGFVASLRPVLGRLALPVALGSPAALRCAVVGQNGFLTAGLMAGTLVFLDRRPWLAGLLLGALTYKPQYGPLFPLVLALTGRWRCFAGAALTALGLAAASALVFGGPGVWGAFAASLTLTTNDVLLAGGSAWDKLQSVYALLYRASGSAGLALAGHAVLALAAAWAAVRLWLRPGVPHAVRAAALVAAAFLATPYAYIYDMPVLTVAVAFLLRDGLDRGFRPWDSALLVAGTALPLLQPVVGNPAGVAAALLVLAVALRRGRGPG